MHGREPGRLRRERPVPRRGRLQSRERHRARIRTRRTAPRAATRTPARRPTPARRARARARTRSSAPPLDQCHAAGVCNPATGMCSNPNRPNGTACTDGNACTQTDTCQAGVVRGRTRRDVPGARPVPRSRASAIRRPACARIRRSRTARPCSDENGCTQADTCQAGTVHGGDSRRLHGVGRLPRRRRLRSGDGYVLGAAAEPDGTACNDGSACTQTDACQAGMCVGSNGSRVHRFGPMPRRGHLRPGDGHLLGSCKARRHGVRRRERVHGRSTPAEAACVRAERRLRRHRILDESHDSRSQSSRVRWVGCGSSRERRRRKPRMARLRTSRPQAS